MKGPQHLSIGAVSAGVVLWGAQAMGVPLGAGVALTGAAIACVGSLAPDIDHPKALIGNRIPATLLSFGVLLLLTPAALRLGSRDAGVFAGLWSGMLQWTTPMLKWGVLLVAISIALFFVSSKVTSLAEHRGPVHSLAAAGAATAVLLVICLVFGLTPWFAVLLGIGWLSHLMADAITPDGLPCLLWPRIELEVTSGSRLFGLLLIPLVLCGLFGWVSATKSFAPATAAAPAIVTPTVSDPSSTANVPLARQRLQEAAPDIAAALVNADAPVVTQTGAYTSYAWQYLRKQTSSSVAVKTIKVTLDGSGHIVGVDEQ